jgi:hypothetical protein
LQGLGAASTRANVRFDDHDAAEAGNNRYLVASVRSRVCFLDRADAPLTHLLVTLDGPVKPATRY